MLCLLLEMKATKVAETRNDIVNLLQQQQEQQLSMVLCNLTEFDRTTARVYG